MPDPSIIDVQITWIKITVKEAVKSEAVAEGPIKENANRHIIDSCACNWPRLGNFRDLRRESFFFFDDNIRRRSYWRTREISHDLIRMNGKVTCFRKFSLRGNGRKDVPS